MSLINEDKLIHDLQILEHFNNSDVPEWVKGVINGQPKVEEQQKFGEWIFDEFDEPHCSVCAKSPLQNGDGSDALSAYCPYCGARMVFLYMDFSKHSLVNL